LANLCGLSTVLSPFLAIVPYIFQILAGFC
jgi:hypothetical protein